MHLIWSLSSPSTEANSFIKKHSIEDSYTRCTNVISHERVMKLLLFEKDLILRTEDQQIAIFFPAVMDRFCVILG